MAHLTAFGAALLISVLSAVPQRGVNDGKMFVEFLPLTDADWRTEASPGTGGDHAVILTDSYIFDDSDQGYRSFLVSRYLRVHVLDQKGLDDFRSVEIRFFTGSQVENLTARTVKSNGTIVPLDGSDVREEAVVSLGRDRARAKVFDFKDAGPGDILEYFYTIRYPHMVAPFAQLQHDVYTSKASVLWWYLSPPNIDRTAGDLLDRYTWTSAWIIPNGKQLKPEVEERGEPGRRNRLSLEIHDIPALPDEPYMPSRSDLAVSFAGYYVYPRLDAKRPYWERTAKELGAETRAFQKKRSRLDPWMADILGRTRNLDVDLKDCFDRIHRDVRNLSALEDSELPAKIEDCGSIDDVLEHGYGTSYQIDCLLVAMLERLGYTATVFWTRDREMGTFIPEWKAASQLGTSGVAVKTAQGEMRYCLPALPGTTPEMLPWEICGTDAMLEDPGDEGAAGSFHAIDVIPMAGGDGNEARLGVRVRPGDDGRLSGRLSATWNLKNDPFLKLEIARASVKSRPEALEAVRRLVLPPALQWTAFEESLAIGETSISYACSLEVGGLVRDAGEGRLCDLGSIRCDDYSIPDGVRETNLDFHLPRRIATNVTLIPPEGFEPGDPQEPFQMIERYAEFRRWITRDDGEVTLHRDLFLPHCAYKAESAELFRSFFLQMQENGGRPIVLRRTGTR